MVDVIEAVSIDSKIRSIGYIEFHALSAISPNDVKLTIQHPKTSKLSSYQLESTTRF
jgi:hypothetical protein